MRAYMQFDLIYVHFHLMADLKWIFSNVMRAMMQCDIYEAEYGTNVA